MKKLTDRITKQRLTCGCITLEQSSGIPEYSGFRKLLLPLQEAHSEAMGETNDTDHHPDQQSELVYESTSRPNGDNVKSLWIYDACIYFIYGAFMHVKDFFSNLPDPEVWTRDDISSSMQIGDRWYRIGGGGGGSKQTFPGISLAQNTGPLLDLIANLSINFVYWYHHVLSSSQTHPLLLAKQLP